MKLGELPSALHASELRSEQTVARFARNDSGRDLVVGDIHGMFAHLRSLLDRIGFDPSIDRLFSTIRGSTPAEATTNSLPSTPSTPSSSTCGSTTTAEGGGSTWMIRRTSAFGRRSGTCRSQWK